MPKSRKSETPPSFLSGEQRLNKVLAGAGLGSRRQVEELIEQGRVEIDGETCTEFHRKVDLSTSKIMVDGQSLKKQRAVYYAVNKPAGVLCTNRDPHGRSRVIDFVPGSARLFPVGRLDRSSLGLILLTNDGELAQRLAHPKYSVAKSYYVVVQGQIGNEELHRLRRGIYLAEGIARVEGAKIRKIRKGCTELDITLTEGKNREIRRVLARLGHKVMVLRRIAIGPLRLADLPEGGFRPLRTAEVAALYKAAEEAKRLSRKKRGEKETSKLSNDSDVGEDPNKENAKKPTRKDQELRKRRRGKASSKMESLENDPSIVDRFDDDIEGYEDDESLVPQWSDTSDHETEDLSSDIDANIPPHSVVVPVWSGNDDLVSTRRGGVIDYEEESSTEPSRSSSNRRSKRGRSYPDSEKNVRRSTEEEARPERRSFKGKSPTPSKLGQKRPAGDSKSFKGRKKFAGKKRGTRSDATSASFHSTKGGKKRFSGKKGGRSNPGKAAPTSSPKGRGKRKRS